MPYKIRVQRKTGKWEDEVGLIQVVRQGEMM
jgi:hypothetical protein